MAGHRILHEIRREMENIVKYRVKLKHAESTFSLQKLFMWSCTKASPNATMHVGQVFAAALCWLLSFTHNPPPPLPPTTVPEGQEILQSGMLYGGVRLQRKGRKEETNVG